VEYLRGNATASATGLFVICRHLTKTPAGQGEDDLRRSLQPLRSPSSDLTDSGSVLTASMAVAEGLGIVKRDGATAPWTVAEDWGGELRAQDDGWTWFRGALLHRMNQHALRELESIGSAPDLLVALTWFLQLNPLEPVQSSWGSGPEPLVRAIGLDAVARSEQWRPFQRWAIAIGVARSSDIGNAKVVIPDATTAIADQLQHLPAESSARDWLAALQARLPIFGASALVDQLPQGSSGWRDLPPGVVLGLLKLEKAGAIRLKASDDADDIVAFNLGQTPRQVGRISVEKVVA